MFLQEGEIRTHIYVQKITYEEEGRDWGDPINQGNAKDGQQTTRNKRTGMEQTPSLLSGGTDSADTLTSDSFPPELQDDPFLLFKHLPVCGTLLWPP